jgi:hypothetical protein
MYVSIIGVVFATAWAGGVRYMKDHAGPSYITSTAFRSDAPVRTLILEHGPNHKTTSAYENPIPFGASHNITKIRNKDSTTLRAHSKEGNAIELACTQPTELS